MSAILLTNPLAAQLPPPSLSDRPQAAAVSRESAGPEAISPAQTASDGQTSGSSTAYSGTGSGAGGNGAHWPASSGRRSDATPRSVVTAQATSNAAAYGVQMAQANSKQAPTVAGHSLPEVINTSQEVREAANQMPDPLPTSPFLRRQ